MVYLRYNGRAGGYEGIPRGFCELVTRLCDRSPHQPATVYSRDGDQRTIDLHPYPILRKMQHDIVPQEIEGEGCSYTCGNRDECLILAFLLDSPGPLQLPSFEVSLAITQ